MSLASKLARRKSQRKFLDLVSNMDLCSSIKPSIGKVFMDSELESLKYRYLEECRLNILQISITEAENDIVSLKKELKNVFWFH